MAIVIGAPASGSGKTTVTLAILAAMRRRGVRIQSFKVGPDYIDPMFHQAITGLPCRTLDPFLTSEGYVQGCFAHHSRDRSGAIVEGVMGLFDGKVQVRSVGSLGSDAEAPGDLASTAHVARLLDLPVVLVVDGSKLGQSIAALVYGLIHYDPRLQIAGVILNRIGSQRHGEILTGALASLGVPILGAIQRMDGIQLPSRHLGLIPVGELSEFEEIQTQLADLAERCLDWDRLLPLLKTDRDRGCDHREDPAIEDRIGPPQGTGLRIGVAQDRAFNFYYPDNLDLLRAQGAEVIPFSPLRDGWDPARSCHGLYLGGGFPEMVAAELSEQIQRWQNQGSPDLPPLYAECGGLMVLGRSLTDLEGVAHPMLNRLPLDAHMGSRLTLGYRSAVALRSTLALTPGQQVRGHEFHRSQVDPAPPPQPIYHWDQRSEGWGTHRIQASYLHLHWGDQPQILTRLLQQIRQRASLP